MLPLDLTGGYMLRITGFHLNSVKKSIDQRKFEIELVRVGPYRSPKALNARQTEILNQAGDLTARIRSSKKKKPLLLLFSSPEALFALQDKLQGSVFALVHFPQKFSDLTFRRISDCSDDILDRTTRIKRIAMDKLNSEIEEFGAFNFPDSIIDEASFEAWLERIRTNETDSRKRHDYDELLRKQRIRNFHTKQRRKQKRELASRTLKNLLTNLDQVRSAFMLYDRFDTDLKCRIELIRLRYPKENSACPKYGSNFNGSERFEGNGGSDVSRIRTVKIGTFFEGFKHLPDIFCIGYLIIKFPNKLNSRILQKLFQNSVSTAEMSYRRISKGLNAFRNAIREYYKNQGIDLPIALNSENDCISSEEATFSQDFKTLNPEEAFEKLLSMMIRQPAKYLHKMQKN